jgi:type II secretory pathway pseudopilin PulG
MNQVLNAAHSAAIRSDRGASYPGAHHRRARTGAFTLVEVMIAAILFTLVSLSIGFLYVQNNRMATRLRYRTNATNAALNVLEQIRVLDFSNLLVLHTTASSPTNAPAYIRVLIADPNAVDHTTLDAPDPTNTSAAPWAGFGADTIPLKFQNLDVYINVLDGTEVQSAWNTCTLPLESSPTAPRMNMRFWLTLKYNTVVSGDAAITATGQVFEIILVYQWQQPGSSASSVWSSGTVKAVVQNPMPKVIGT